ncbi:hypothetical protein [Streptomyces sp. NPDC086776]|uniref:hypothetical protein n=1 Tax=Streptomyces sp. NPDC086776 TaxID=3365756 RepID=UPI00382272A8
MPGTVTGGRNPKPIPFGNTTGGRTPKPAGNPLVSAYEKLTPVEKQKVSCATGGFTKGLKIFKVVKAASSVETKGGAIALTVVNVINKTKAIAKDAAGNPYEVIWDVAEFAPFGVGLAVGCVRVLDKMNQEDAAKFDASIMKPSDLESTLKKNKVGSVKIQQPPGVQQNPLR